MQTFVLQSKSRFWNIDLDGQTCTMTSGKLGDAGTTESKKLRDEDVARKYRDWIVARKLSEGFVETTAGPRFSLARAVVSDPDDLGAHAAYADCLMQQGDVRGEFVQVQLSLEDTGLYGDRRTHLENREIELLEQHARTWLGGAGRFLVGDWSGPSKGYEYRFARGWLDMVRIAPLPECVLAAVVLAPEARLLRQLEIVLDSTTYDFDGRYRAPAGIRQAMTPAERRAFREVGDDEESALNGLFASPYLGNLRVFRLGFSDFGQFTMAQIFGGCRAESIVSLIQRAPRLQELYLNTHLTGIEKLFAFEGLENLRVLQYYFGQQQLNYVENRWELAYPLNILAGNKSLKNLTKLRLCPSGDLEPAHLDVLLRSPHLPALRHLHLHKTTLGDEGCRIIVDSGILRRLKVLDLSNGNVTDAGAAVLAGCKDLENLEMLNIWKNAMTLTGVAALEATGVRLGVLTDQHGLEDNEYLYEGDME